METQHSKKEDIIVWTIITGFFILLLFFSVNFHSLYGGLKKDKNKNERSLRQAPADQPSGAVVFVQ